jgi:hypothetical protein
MQMQMLFSFFLLTENMQSLSFGTQNEQQKKGREREKKMIHKNRTTCSERKRGADLFYI